MVIDLIFSLAILAVITRTALRIVKIYSGENEQEDIDRHYPDLDIKMDGIIALLKADNVSFTQEEFVEWFKTIRPDSWEKDINGYYAKRMQEALVRR